MKNFLFAEKKILSLQKNKSMKKLSLLLCLVGGLLFSQQEKTIKFNKKLSYYQVNDKGVVNNELLDFYLSDSEYVLQSYPYSPYLTLYDKENKNTAVISIHPITQKVDIMMSSFGRMDYSIKTEEVGNLNGRKCMFYKNEGWGKACVDEQSKYDNFSILNHQAKGEVLFFQEGDERLELQEKSDMDYTLIIDIEEIKKQIEKQTIADSIEVANIIEDEYTPNYDPLFNPYMSKTFNEYGNSPETNKAYDYAIRFSTFGYTTDERDKEVNFLKKSYKSYAKNLHSAGLVDKNERKELVNILERFIQEVENYVPSQIVDNQEYINEAVDYNFNFYTPYQSVYKDEKVEKNMPLALNDILNDEKIVKNMPNFCSNLPNTIPNFENENLSLHLHNYLGQLCDLYLYQNGGAVGYFETLNSMRKSLLEIELIQSSLSEKDKIILTNIIKNLD